MKKKPASKSAFFTLRFILSFALCSIGALLTVLASGRSDQSVQQQTAPSLPVAQQPYSVNWNPTALSNRELLPEMFPMSQTEPEVPFAYVEKAPYPNTGRLPA